MNLWIVTAWLVTTGSVVGLAAAAVWLWLGSRAARATENEDGGPADHGFSFARYQVMERLLSSRDLQFLASQSGKPADIGKWKRESLSIFRTYLGELSKDFQALHGYARRMVAESHVESPDLAATLVRQQATFYRTRVALEFRLILFALGIGSVDVAPLLQMVEAMRLDLGRLVPEAEPSL